MAESTTVATLRRKRDDIATAIKLYEKQLAQARADLAHITAALRIFEVEDGRTDIARYVDTYRIFKRGEMWSVCRAALEAEGALTTRELALRVMKAKGLDQGDKVLAKGISYKLIHVLRMQSQRGNLALDGKRQGVSVWRIPMGDSEPQAYLKVGS